MNLRAQIALWAAFFVAAGYLVWYYRARWEYRRRTRNWPPRLYPDRRSWLRRKCDATRVRLAPERRLDRRPGEESVVPRRFYRP